MLLYLHGFTSGPQSHKAVALHARMTERGFASQFLSPQLAASPRESIAIAEDLITRYGVTTVVGSSLGGYYATYLAERHGLKAVLVNPAVIGKLKPAGLVGTHRWLYSDEPFEFTLSYVEELKALECGALTHPERFWLLAETGDETLDYRHAVERYGGTRQTVLEGGDHSFTRWDEYLDEIISFAGIPSVSG